MSGALHDAVAGLPAVGLREVLDHAALQHRLDRKYLLPRRRIGDLIERLTDTMAALEINGRRSFHYDSVYFDSADLLCYRAHLQGRRRRFKLRTRTYLDSGDCELEVKFEGGRAETDKVRTPHAPRDRSRLTPAGHAFASEQLRRELRLDPPPFIALLNTVYRRATLVDRHGEMRVTLDVGFTCIGRDRVVRGPADLVFVEVKSNLPRTRADRALLALGVAQVSVSKYCLAVALLDPRVRANPWNHILRRHFGWQRAGGPSAHHFNGDQPLLGAAAG